MSLSDRPLREWETRLPAKHFARIHRSTIVNLNQVEKIDSLFNKTMELSLRGYQATLSVSRRYATKLKEKFG